MLSSCCDGLAQVPRPYTLNYIGIIQILQAPRTPWMPCSTRRAGRPRGSPSAKFLYAYGKSPASPAPAARCDWNSGVWSTGSVRNPTCICSTASTTSTGWMAAMHCASPSTPLRNSGSRRTRRRPNSGAQRARIQVSSPNPAATSFTVRCPSFSATMFLTRAIFSATSNRSGRTSSAAPRADRCGATAFSFSCTGRVSSTGRESPVAARFRRPPSTGGILAAASLR